MRRPSRLPCNLSLSLAPSLEKLSLANRSTAANTSKGQALTTEHTGPKSTPSVGSVKDAGATSERAYYKRGASKTYTEAPSRRPKRRAAKEEDRVGHSRGNKASPGEAGGSIYTRLEPYG